ncbi:tripartite tricarboxylate transporter substrate binding protein [Desulfovibrio sp. OttesenSCG-928-O18]|nr:tripartite tricarboxylate transporter substrate binding protein [Desulfovibrio sp. OttesenSCG-928-O18]
MKKRLLFPVFFIAAFLTAAPCASAADYPAKSVETLVGYAAGGASDIIARVVAQHLGKELGQPVVVMNKEGAGGEIAYTGVATARPDGYTLGYINAPATLSIPLSRKTNYTMDNFAFIGNVIYHENLIVVDPASPYKSVQDLLKAAKEKPGELTVGNSGAYADDHLASLKAQYETKVKFKDVMFKGTAPSLVALMGKHIDAVVCNVADIVQKHKDGQVVVLATMGMERNRLFPNAPTLKELGYDVIMGNYTTLAAPAKTPPAVLEKLRAALKKVANDPAYIKAAGTDAGLPIKYYDAAEIAAIYKKANSDLHKLWEDLKLPRQ